jgi:hypothetical protein
MLLALSLGLALWILVSVPLALFFARALSSEGGATESIELEDELLLLGPPTASAPSHVQLDRVDLPLPVGTRLDRAGGADQVAGVRQRVRA